jgi:sec-independent protein translocase protein TatB
MQRYVNDVKADISREIELDELRKFKTEFENAATSVESTIHSELNKTQSSLDDATKDVKEIAALVDGKAVEGAAPVETPRPAAAEAGSVGSTPSASTPKQAA